MRIQVNKRNAKLVSADVITTGSTSLRAELVFSADWKGFAKTAVCIGGGVVKDVLQWDSNTIVIPWECLKTAGGRLLIGVYGVKDTAVIPTVYCDCGDILKGAEPTGDTSTTPTLPVYSQLQAAVTALQAAMQAYSVPDTQLQSNIAAYLQANPLDAYTKAQIDSKIAAIDTVNTAQANAITANTNDITAEVTARKSAIDTVTAKANNNADAIAAEATVRASADSTLTAAVQALQTSIAAANAEIATIKRQLGDIDSVLDAFINAEG